VRPLADGLVMGDGAGRVLRVFAPRWWQVWRWVRWLLFAPEARSVCEVVLLDEQGAAHPLRTRFVVDAVRR